MLAWPPQPRIFEIPTWPWLSHLSVLYGQEITLANVPEEVVAEMAQGADAVWLMGVWERSSASRQCALEIPELREAYARAVPDVEEADVVGSPYAVHAYTVEPRLGGDAGLQRVRAQLAHHGCRLILDYVPNHVARDHVWTWDAPDMFIQGDPGESCQRGAFFPAGERVLAHGRDPYFPAWTDTAQLNAWSADYRTQAIATLCELAEQCDGVRCDMAMLLLNEVFDRTWGARAGSPLPQEFWDEVITAVRQQHPRFWFMAEVYWDKEWELQQQGFNFCYDKRFYERVVQADAEGLRVHLAAALSYQTHLVRFLENHDEPRAASVLAAGQAHAAALLCQCVPGARMLFLGQAQGARIKLPVQLRRGPDEPTDTILAAWYQRLTTLLPTREGGVLDKWRLCHTQVLQAAHNPFVALTWDTESGPWLVVINFGPVWAQGYISLPLPTVGNSAWTFSDQLNQQAYTYPTLDVMRNGLYVALDAWQSHVFHLSPEA